MKIAYGSSQEKHLLGAAFLLASATCVGLLLWQKMLSFPYLWIPVYLFLCGILFISFPLSRLNRSVILTGLYRLSPTLFFMVAIFLASSLTPSPNHSLELSDYYLHTAEFFVLGLFTARMVHPARNRWSWFVFFLLSMGIVGGYGVLDEIHQHYVPGRNPSVRDVLWDLIGGIGGILAYTLLVSFFARKT